MRGKAIVWILLLVLLAAGGGTATWLLWDRSSPEEKIGHELRELLLSRQTPDGAFGYDLGAKADFWNTGEAVAAFAAFGQATDHDLIRDKLRYCLSGNLPTPVPGVELPHGGWPVDSGDTVGAGEPTGWVGIGLGVAHARLGAEFDADAAAVRDFLLALQNPDGSFSSVFIGPEGGRSSATQDCLLALLVLDTVKAEKHPAVVDAVVKGLEWFGESFDTEAKVWHPRVRRGWKQRGTVPGCSEMTAWVTLEALDYLAEAKREAPLKAREAIRAYAENFRSDHRALDSALPANKSDYQFNIPQGYSATWGAFGHRWSWFPYRTLCVVRLAATPGLPRGEDWSKEAAWNVEQLANFRQAIDRGATFQVSDGLLVASILSHREAGHPKRGSLLDLIRSLR
jgi:hypothetical protein